MASPSASGSRNFPEGYRATPVFESGKESPLRLCVVIRDVSEPGAGVFVQLRDTGDATVHLGCLVDAGGRVYEWLELWVQSVDRLGSAPEAARGILNNAVLDERWKRRAAMLGQMDPAGKIETEAERAHPLPIYYDIAVTRPVRPAAAGVPWELCVDDEVLVANGLPPYHGSLARYLCAGGKAPFIPVTADAAESNATQAAAVAFRELLPFNADGGLMMIRKLAPLGFEAWLGLLSGTPWKGIEEGARNFSLNGAYAELGDAGAIRSGAGLLFFGSRGVAGRLAEAFHLKLAALGQVFGLAADYAGGEQAPLLNLSAASFRVRLAETGAGLPVFWTARVTLASPGAAVSLPGAPGRWLAAAGLERSVYRPRDLPAGVRGAGEIRLGGVVANADGLHTIEGSLLTQEPLGLDDLLWLRIPLPMGRLDLFATFTGEKPVGTYNFLTLPKGLDQYQQAALESAKLASIGDVAFETLPNLSAAVDLYSLGVLGVRALLVNDENGLSAAIEELFAFAQTIAAGESEKLGERVRAAVAADPRWQNTLGPHRLLNAGSVSEQEGAAFLPPEIWWDAVALLVRCFPGLIVESFNSGIGSAPAGAMEAVFAEPAQALHELQVRSRSVLFSDWKSTSEIRDVLRDVLRRQPKTAPPAQAGKGK